MSRGRKESHRIIIIMMDGDLYGLISWYHPCGQGQGALKIGKWRPMMPITVSQLMVMTMHDNNWDNSYFFSTNKLKSSKQFSSSLPSFLDGIPGEARGRHHWRLANTAAHKLIRTLQRSNNLSSIFCFKTRLTGGWPFLGKTKHSKDCQSLSGSG